MLPADESFIEEILNISRVCRVNSWSAADYIHEINRSDSFHSVGFEKSRKKVIGFVLARLIKFEEDPSAISNQEIIKNSQGNSEAEILTIAVIPERQKEGIGQIIFDGFLKFCIENKVRTIWLEVRESNFNARQFYIKNGFQGSHKRKNYYREPLEDALVMRRDLNTI